MIGKKHNAKDMTPFADDKQPKDYQKTFSGTLD